MKQSIANISCIFNGSTRPNAVIFYLFIFIRFVNIFQNINIQEEWTSVVGMKNSVRKKNSLKNSILFNTHWEASSEQWKKIYCKKYINCIITKRYVGFSYTISVDYICVVSFFQMSKRPFLNISTELSHNIHSIDKKKKTLKILIIFLIKEVTKKKLLKFHIS